MQVRLLPYLDQEALYHQLDLAEDGVGEHNEPPTSSHNPAALTWRVPVFECPSDQVPAGGNTYRANIGAGPGYQAVSTLGPFTPFRTSRASQMVDGLSHTAFFCERLVGDRKTSVFTPARDYFFSGGSIITAAEAEQLCQLPVGVTPQHFSYSGATWLFSGFAHTYYNHVRTPNSVDLDCANAVGGWGAFTARSLHRQGVNVALGDGAVRFVGNSIDINVWRALATHAGGESTSDD
jgi:hypothetical protein